MEDATIKRSDTLPDGLRGIVTVLNTPFTEEGSIDLESLQRNVLRALKAGVAGFLVPALAGEVGQLTQEERIQLVSTVQDTIRAYGTAGASASTGEMSKRASFPPWVIGGATAGNQKERMVAAEALLRLGCDGILAWIPYTIDEEYYQEVKELAALKPPFLMLQDWDPSGPGLPLALILRLFEEVEEFKALKIETVPAGPKYTTVLRATRGALHVSGGWAVTQMIEALDRGVHAFMPTGMHEIYCEIYRRYAAGNRDGAVTLFRRILPVLVFSNQHLDLSIRFFKRLLWREGTYATPLCRKLAYSMDEYQERIADELIQLAIQVRQGMGKPTSNC